MTDTANTPIDNDNSPPRHPAGLHARSLTWRHRAWILEYIRLGFDDPAQAAINAGVAVCAREGERVARRYLEMPAVQEAIRNALRDNGICEKAIRHVVQRWMWHEDGNLALRAAELAAKLLGLLREPAPAVPQLPPLIVVQALPAVTAPDAVQASYTVESVGEELSISPLIAVSAETQTSPGDPRKPAPSKVLPRSRAKPVDTRGAGSDVTDGVVGALPVKCSHTATGTPAKRKKRPSARQSDRPGQSIRRGQ